MSRIRPRPMIYRLESLEAPGNEADIARMIAKLKMRTGGDVSDRQCSGKSSIAVGAASTENTQPGLPFASAGFTAESPGPSSAEVTCSAGGGYTGAHVSFPPLAIGPTSEQSTVSIPRSVGAALSDGRQPRRILEWESPVEGATAVKTQDGRYSCCKVIVDGKSRYEAWKLIPAGAWFRPLAQNLDSFAAVKLICENDFNGIHST